MRQRVGQNMGVDNDLSFSDRQITTKDDDDTLWN